MQCFRAAGSSRMCRKRSITRDRNPGKATAWVRFKSMRGPPRLANCTAWRCSRVRRSANLNKACRVSDSTGMLINETSDL